MVFLDFSEFEIINAFIEIFNSDFVTIDKIPLSFSRRGSRGRRGRGGSTENRIHGKTRDKRRKTTATTHGLNQRSYCLSRTYGRDHQ